MNWLTIITRVIKLLNQNQLENIRILIDVKIIVIISAGIS